MTKVHFESMDKKTILIYESVAQIAAQQKDKKRNSHLVKVTDRFNELIDLNIKEVRQFEPV